VSALEQAGHEPAYVHDAKLARPEPSIMLGESVLKWYDIAPDDEPVPLAIRALARRCLRDAVKTGELTAEGELGFVILHRCGDAFYFLLVSTWRNENELWETVWAKDVDDALFRPFTIEGTHRPTFCVWELGAVAHERDAWTRFLRSPRDAGARREYLRDCYVGLV
jgi:hypothetical protein